MVNLQNDIDKYVLEPDQCKIIYNMAYLSLVASLYAIYQQQYIFACCPGGVFVTSICYWSKPTFDTPRRYIDIVYVSSSLVYQIYRAYYSQYMVIYYTIVLCAVSFYPLGYYYYYRNRYWESTYAHCTLHILGNISNLVLYSSSFGTNEELQNDMLEKNVIHFSNTTAFEANAIRLV